MVEHHRWRIAMAREQQFRRRLSGKLHPRGVLQDSEQGQRRNMRASVPHLATILVYMEHTISGSRKAMKDPSNQNGAQWPE